MRLWAASAIAFVLGVGEVYGERLPIEPLTVAQGLPSNTIHRIVRDSRGFLWFCTGDGLSRFDGRELVTFGVAQGLPGRNVMAFIETQTGDYWVGTNGGAAFIPGSGVRRVDVVHPAEDTSSRIVRALKQTSDGSLWFGTEGGLYRMDKGSRTINRVDTGPRPEAWTDSTIYALEEDGTGNLWFGSNGGIGRINNHSRVDRWTPRHGFISFVVETLLRDTDGTIWAGTENGLCHMLRHPEPGTTPAQRCYGLKDGLPSPYTMSVERSADGTLWVGTLEGAAFARPRGSDLLKFTSITRRHGLIDNNIEAVAEDIEGNIWMGAANDGVMKLSRDDIVVFTEADGLVDPNVVGFFEDQQGFLYSVTRSSSGVVLNRFDGAKFLPIRPVTPQTVRAFGSGLQQVALHGRDGRWWVATGEGLLQYRTGDIDALRTLPDVFSLPVIPDGNNVRRLFEDSRGDVWWSTSSRISNGLGRWNHATGKVDNFSSKDGLPPLVLESSLIVSFVEDNSGRLWLGFQGQGLARMTSSGSFEYFDPKSYWPIDRIRVAYRDSRGRLWFGASNGLWRLDDPNAMKPSLRQYSVADGLSNPAVHSLTEDLQGRIYIATGKSLDRLDPESGRIEHFSSLHGFPTGIIQASYRDRNGYLWLGTRHGVTRFMPRATAETEVPLGVRITAIKVRGAERLVSAGGEAALAGVELSSDEDQVEFEFGAPHFRSGELLYQYRLEGSRSPEWSPLSVARSVNFASLPPGSYRFLVRAVNALGAEAAPAVVAFRILPPFWMTWWFRLAAVLALAVTAYALYRYRVAAVLERERLRFRIATDLHDDIGSSLSTIAIWSDLAVRQAEGVDNKLIPPLQQIGAVSREVIDSVSDIVWAINPKHDRFTDLTSRMRRHVGDLAAGLPFPIAFTTDGDEHDVNIGPVVRREVFLIFKEAINNVVRHSQCTHCSVSLHLTSGWMTVRISDNGRGIDPNNHAGGNGLESMRRRAERLGGILRLMSVPSQGTTIELQVPAAGKGRRLWKKEHRK